jgi:acetyl esterase
MSVALDPATAALLAQMHAGGGKPLNQLTVDEVRGIVAASHAALSGTSIEVGSVADRTIDADGHAIPLRIYTPSGEHPTPLPVVMFFHGGGFAAGSLDTHAPTARYLCQNANVIVVAVGYRKPPEHRFPAAIDDALAATEWAAINSREIGGNGITLAVAGDSAGGNIATVVCQLASQRGTPAIAFQLLLYPQVDLTLANSPSREQFGSGEFFLSNEDIEWLRNLYLADPSQASDPRVSPLLAPDLRGMPPALIVAAGCDLMRDEGKAYADRLSDAGVPVEYRCFDGTIHAFMSFDGAIPMGREALAFAASRLRAALHQAQTA